MGQNCSPSWGATLTSAMPRLARALTENRRSVAQAHASESTPLPGSWERADSAHIRSRSCAAVPPCRSDDNHSARKTLRHMSGQTPSQVRARGPLSSRRRRVAGRPSVPELPRPPRGTSARPDLPRTRVKLHTRSPDSRRRRPRETRESTRTARPSTSGSLISGRRRSESAHRSQVRRQHERDGCSIEEPPTPASEPSYRIEYLPQTPRDHKMSPSFLIVRYSRRNGLGIKK